MSRRLTEKFLVVASHNAGKVREIRELLTPFGIETISAGDLGLPEPEETGATFQANAELKLGVCGEHGGDPSSIELFNRIGLDYVSCSPYRVPVARVAAAQAAIRSA